MSHGKLLAQRINDAIDAGHYRAKGTPRAKEPAKSSPGEDIPAPTPRATPAKRAEASTEQKRGTPDPQSFVQGLVARRRDSVGESVHKALDERFKKR
jgi:hypothetical protein